MEHGRNNRVLFVEDDPVFTKMVGDFLTRKGFEVSPFSRVSEAIRELKTHKYDLLLLDFRLPDGEGLEVLQAARVQWGHIPSVIMTSVHDIRVAVRAMKAGAVDYITKPVNQDELLMIIRQALVGDSNNTEAVSAVNVETHVEGETAASAFIYEQVALVAPTEMCVLIQGESGTGKEYIARRIHRESRRSEGPFLALDCGALTRDLAGSAFFGHVKGAFTGADQDKKGVFQEARGGTVFLDEIGNLPYEVQVKLLRALQERHIIPVGSSRELPMDIRLIAATNEALDLRVAEGEFRADLFYRLNEFPLRVPPLRERLEDLPLFIDHFIKQANGDLDRQVRHLNPMVMAMFRDYDWPGNLRELRNVIRRAVLLCREDTIRPEVLPAEMFRAGGITEDATDLRSQREKSERELVLETLRSCDNNKSRAAQKLGIDRKTLYNKMHRYGIPFR
jgi:two-component system, NtrC family, response regulator HydG